MKHFRTLLPIVLALILVGIGPATALADARPTVRDASYIPKWPQDYADSPCSAKNVKWWIKNVVEQQYGYNADFYENQSFCALPISEACLAQQYNSAHNTHLPFYTNKTFYRRCLQAYAHIRALRRARPAHWSACDIIGWASIISAPFIPVESLVAKAGMIVFGSALKLRCG